MAYTITIGGILTVGVILIMGVIIGYFAGREDEKRNRR